MGASGVQRGIAVTNINEIIKKLGIPTSSTLLKKATVYLQVVLNFLKKISDSASIVNNLSCLICYLLTSSDLSVDDTSPIRSNYQNLKTFYQVFQIIFSSFVKCNKSKAENNLNNALSYKSTGGKRKKSRKKAIKKRKN